MSVLFDPFSFQFGIFTTLTVFYAPKRAFPLIPIRRYMEMDIQLYEKCSRENTEKTRKLEADREASQQKWALILENATSSGIDISKL